MLGKLKALIFQKYAAAFWRWAATAATAYLVGRFGVPHDAAAEVVNPLIAELAAGVAMIGPLVASWMDKAKNQPVTKPDGTKIVKVVVAPKEDPMPKAKEPVFIK